MSLSLLRFNTFKSKRQANNPDGVGEIFRRSDIVKELKPERRVADRHFLSNDDDSRADVPFNKFPEMLRQGFQVMAE